MTPEQADRLKKQLTTLSTAEWQLFWRWITLAFIEAITPEYLKEAP